MSSFWKYRKVLVTGANGFLGTAVCARLRQYEAEVSKCLSYHGDLTSLSHTMETVRSSSPEVVINCAAKCGGIGYNKENPSDLFMQNMEMGLNIIKACSRYNAKLVMIGTTCSYPKYCAIPFMEEDLFNGYPEETNAPYGIAKRSLLTACQAYRNQYGLRFAYIIPANLYGPGDHFEDTRSHVIPAMIKRFHHSENKPVTLWGTGKATRDFLYIYDAVDGILKAAELYDADEPINIGGGYEHSINNIRMTIQAMTGSRSHVAWDASRPDGQPRRLLDITRAERILGWKPTIPIEWGLREAYSYYKDKVCILP